MKRLAAFLFALVLSACAFTTTTASPPESVSSDRQEETDGYHFLAIGDWGTGWSMQYALARQMCELKERKPFDIVITAGDNIYEKGARRDFDAKFYQPFACLFNRGARFHATLGNHDIQTRNGRPELREERFGMRGRNYVLREGGVRFVMANSNRLKKRWLRRALKTEEGDRWTVVVFHHPVYSSSSGHESTGDFRYTLPKMFARRGVDLSITGHTHVYAVTQPLKKIRYVTTGGGSASPHECKRHWYTARCKVRYHFLSIVAGEDEIVVTAISQDGDVIHRFRTEGRD